MNLSDMIDEQEKKEEPQKLSSLIAEQEKSKSNQIQVGEEPSGGLFGLLGLLGVKEKQMITPPQPDQPLASGQTYPLGQDPTKGFGGNVLESLTDPTEIAMQAATGGLAGPATSITRQGVRGLIKPQTYVEAAKTAIPMAKKFAYEWVPDLYKGLSGGARSFLDALSAKSIETRIPVEKALPGLATSVEDVAQVAKTQSDKLFDSIYWNYPPYHRQHSSLDKSKILTNDLNNTRAKMGQLLQEQDNLLKQTSNPVEIAVIKTNFDQQMAPLKEIEGQLKTAFDKITYADTLHYEKVTSLHNKPSIKGLSPDDVVASGHTPSALNKEHYDLLESKIPYEEVSGPLKGVKKAWGEIGSIWKSAGSKLEYEPTGRGKVAYQILEEAHRDKIGWLNKEHKPFLNAVKDIKPRSAEDKELGRLLNTYESWTDIPVYEQLQIKPQIRSAFEYMRPNWSRNYDELVAMGVAKPERKLEAYLFHTFPKGQIVAGWKGRAEAIQNQLASSGIDAKLTSKLKDELVDILENIKVWENQGTLLYRNIPKTIKAPFLEERLGAEGYDLYAIPAYERWLGIAGRKRFDEPAIRKYLDLTKSMPTEYKRFAHKFARDYIGYETGQFEQIKKIEHYITSLEYIHAMALNPRIAVQNLTQELNTLVEVGPKSWMKGMARALSKEGRAEWLASNHATEIPGLTGVSERAGIVSKVATGSAYLHQKTESALRRHAYAAGIEKALDKGLPYDKALQSGDEVIRWTQFLYGNMAGRQFLKAPGMTVVGQFGTFGLGQTELFEHWARTNPKKLVAYLALANGIAAGASYGVKEVGERFVPGAEQFAIDLWTSIGIGVDPVELSKAVRDLFKGETKAAGIHAQSALPRFAGGAAETGPLPQFLLPSYQTAKNILTKDPSYIMPVQMKRMAETGRSLLEGETTTKLSTPKSSTGLPESDIKTGYPVREMNWGKVRQDPRFVLTPAELAIRTFAFKPWEEAETQKMRVTEQILASRKNDMREDLRDNIFPLLLQGRSTEATYLTTKYKPEVWASFKPQELLDIAKETKKGSDLTYKEKTVLEAWTNKQKMIFRIGIGQTSGDKSKSSP